MAEEIEVNTPDEIPHRNVNEYVPVKDRFARARQKSESYEATRPTGPKPNKDNEREIER